MNFSPSTLSGYIGQALGGMERYCKGSRAGVVKGDRSTDVTHESTLKAVGFPMEKLRLVAVALLDAGLIVETEWSTNEKIERQRDGTVVVVKPAASGITYRCRGKEDEKFAKPQDDEKLIAQAFALLDSLGISLKCPPGTASSNPRARRNASFRY